MAARMAAILKNRLSQIATELVGQFILIKITEHLENGL